MSKKNEVVKAEVVDETTIAQALTQQYEEAQVQLRRGVESAVKFGAMLIKAEEIVFADGQPKKGNNRESGYGIEAWLAKNCPTVNYKTAMRWKAIAQQACNALGGGVEGLFMLTESEAKIAKVCPPDMIKQRDELFAAGSLRKLSQMCFDFASDDAKGGRPAGEQKQLPKMKKSDEAKAIWNGVMIVLSKSAVRDAIPLLPAKETQICLDKLSELVRELKDHASEF